MSVTTRLDDKFQLTHAEKKNEKEERGETAGKRAVKEKSFENPMA